MEPRPTRRALLRAGVAAGAAALLAACGRSDRGGATPGPSSTTQPPSTPPPSSPASSRPAWSRIDARGPAARRDHSFTGDPASGAAWLFGGRAGEPLDDLWRFDTAASRWERVAPAGARPAARFGHSAVMLDGTLVVFGGQAGSTFFDDVWVLDPAARAWTRHTAAPKPAPRYGSSAAAAGGRLFVTHGFTNDGRFDDTWTWSATWRNDSPSGGPRPVKRCLHATAWWEPAGAVALFGGQTNGNPFLGDFWLYDPNARRWTQTSLASPPSPRNLCALFALGDRLWLFGGNTGDGPSASLHAASFAGKSWTAIEAGAGPSPRHGIEAAVVGDSQALVFGGRGSGGELADLWRLTV